MGRLGSITRGGEAVEYCYDELGRRTRDGALSMSYDANGNRTGIGYPGEVSATYTFDFADREESLTVTTPSTLDQAVASEAKYLPFGPLTAVTLGNELLETRDFDERYHPAGIALSTTPPGHTWTYTTDAVGNVLGVAEIRPCGGSPLVLTDQTVDTTETFESCASIEAGPGFSIVDPGDVTLRATERVVLKDGFSVGSGARLTVSIEPVEGTEEIERTYAYQDIQYYLTGADGPWGSLDWTHDQIGNRLTGTRDSGNPDTYVYTSNGTGNTPILDLVNLGVGGARDYTWGAAGHLEEVAASGNVIDFDSDAEGRLASSARAVAEVAASYSYDGRSFLTQALESTGDPTAEAASVEAVYDSQGLLHALRRQASPADPEELVLYFYLAGRPVAQLSLLDGAETWSYLTTDHLGTPLLATDDAGTVAWEGGFEPFGRDYQAGTPDAALDNGLHLRLPGQWEDLSWHDATSGASVYYNVHRWIEPATGRYTRLDPFGLRYVINLFTYASGNPVLQADPDGRLPTFPVHNPITCSIAVGSEARSRGKGMGWRWAHCWASCEITKSCGGESVAKPFGLLKEVIDLVGCFASSINSVGTGGSCESAFQPTDFEDNEFGRLCPLTISCEERCKDLAGESSPPGPFFGLSLPTSLP
jgi:RHS repeat-associated protein